jgi:hypothetical protein
MEILFARLKPLNRFLTNDLHEGGNRFWQVRDWLTASLLNKWGKESQHFNFSATAIYPSSQSASSFPAFRTPESVRKRVHPSRGTSPRSAGTLRLFLDRRVIGAANLSRRYPQGCFHTAQ